MTPNLVREYQHAMQRVYKSCPTVPEQYNDKFQRLELELMEHRISTKHYAEAQAVLWRPWVEKLGLQHLPLNLFLSIAAKSRYNKLLAMPSVEPILDRKMELLANGMMFEREFANWYLQQIMYKADGIKDEGQALDVHLDSYTNENLLYGWLDFCEEYGRAELMRNLIQQFCDYWHITKSCSSYFQLACRYVDGLVADQRKTSFALKDMDWRTAAHKSLSKHLDKIQNELDQLKYGSLL